MKFKFWKECVINQINNARDAIFNQSEHKIEQLIEHIDSKDGKLFFTGIGKNAHVARKASSTFTSIGIESNFICPVEAVHGEMSNVHDCDRIIAVSKSGKTSELVYFLNQIKKYKKETFVMLIHSNKSLCNSKSKYFDFELCLPLKSEGHDLGIIPISSITTFTIFLQSIGIHIAKSNKFTLEKFLLNHPGGEIGKTKI